MQRDGVSFIIAGQSCGNRSALRHSLWRGTSATRRFGRPTDPIRAETIIIDSGASINFRPHRHAFYNPASCRRSPL